MSRSLQRRKAPHDVYARHLISHRGYPLFVPELKTQLPKDYQDHGLKIGDVGYVVPGQGCFEVLFNICLPLDHALHQTRRLPRNFQPIPLNEHDIATYSDVEDVGRVISSPCVTKIEVDPIEQPSDYNFTLSSSEGALLILPQGADQHTLQCDRLFGKHARQHAVEWYRFVEEDLERTISPDSLYLITGFYKSRSWALASFQEAEGSGETSESVRFKVTPQPEEGDAIARGYSWSTAGRLESRTGPKRRNVSANQAVYISGFKIAVRVEPAGRKKISVRIEDPSVQPHREDFTDIVDSDEQDESKGSESSESTSGKQGGSTNLGLQHTFRQVSLQCIPQVLHPFHPSDIINRFLLRKKSSVRVAITHDCQWGSLLESANGRLEPHDFADEQLVEKLLSERYIITSQDDAAFLEGGKDTEEVWNTGIKTRMPEMVPTSVLVTKAQVQHLDEDSTDVLGFTSRVEGGRFNRDLSRTAPSRFNNDWTAADEQMLLSYASYANDPQNCYHKCFWVTAQGPCSAQIIGSGFSDHMHSSHSITVPDDTLVRCRWSGCATQVKEKQLIQHVQERHLDWKYVCPHCGDRFTRNYTRQNHLKRKHGAN